MPLGFSEQCLEYIHPVCGLTSSQPCSIAMHIRESSAQQKRYLHPLLDSPSSCQLPAPCHIRRLALRFIHQLTSTPGIAGALQAVIVLSVIFFLRQVCLMGGGACSDSSRSLEKGSGDRCQVPRQAHLYSLSVTILANCQAARPEPTCNS